MIEPESTTTASNSLKTSIPISRSYFSFKAFPGQLPELDGLRGLAVILVLLRHGVRPFWSPETALLPFFGWDVANILINGWIGVDLFFVLSGFLITHHILKLQERNEGKWLWKPYLAKRALRIIPAYYVVLLLAVIGVFPGFELADNHLWIRISYHMLFLQDYLPANIVVVFWSLGVEEKFYLVAPFLVLSQINAPTVIKRTLGIIAILFIVIGLRCYTTYLYQDIDNYQHFFPVFRSPFHMSLDPILMGVILAFLYKSKTEIPHLTSVKLANIIFWLGTLLCAGLMTSSAMLDDITWWDKTLQPTVIALSFASITFGLLFGGGTAQIFRTSLLRFFARISYSLYLVHLPLVPLALNLSERFVGEPSLALFFPIFALLSIAAALILHFLVEKPFLQLKDKFT
ncbi:MAG: acyltransferase [Pseudomonadales bacterium]|nr:acyltransferase [Pseudomonadales bacterium]